MVRVSGRELDQVASLYDVQCRIDQYRHGYNAPAQETARIMQDININMLWMITQEQGL